MNINCPNEALLANGGLHCEVDEEVAEVVSLRKSVAKARPFLPEANGTVLGYKMNLSNGMTPSPISA